MKAPKYRIIKSHGKFKVQKQMVLFGCIPTRLYDDLQRYSFEFGSDVTAWYSTLADAKNALNKFLQYEAEKDEIISLDITQ